MSTYFRPLHPGPKPAPTPPPPPQHSIAIHPIELQLSRSYRSPPLSAFNQFRLWVQLELFSVSVTVCEWVWFCFMWFEYELEYIYSILHSTHMMKIITEIKIIYLIKKGEIAYNIHHHHHNVCTLGCSLSLAVYLQ